MYRESCFKEEASRDKSQVMTASERGVVRAGVQHAWLKAQGASLDKPLDSVVLSRIKKLSAMNKLKKAALVVMAQSLSKDEINGLQQLFRSIDADGNGTITVDELRTALSSLNGRLQVPPPGFSELNAGLEA